MSTEHAQAHAANHAHADHEESGAPHGTFRDYMTGFVLAVVLTAIPFFLLMARPIESPGYTAAIVLVCAFAGCACVAAFGAAEAGTAENDVSASAAAVTTAIARLL